MSPIRVGFVGLSSTGWASISLAPPLLSSPLSSHYAITALSTSSPQSAQLAAEKYTALSPRSPQVQVKPYHGSTSSIASDTDVDLVVVSVKTPDHKMALAPAIEKGKDVFVEWPLGNGLEEAKELAGMAREKGVRTMVGMQGWQIPEVKKVKEVIQAGRIGRVLSSTFVSAHFRWSLPYLFRYHLRDHQWFRSAASPQRYLTGHRLLVFVTLTALNRRTVRSSYTASPGYFTC